ncbi:MAG: hypothetical protein A2Y34_10795 [Spirochaetes bacterium GWC1_27_15]|nr:MAG: hypothetical protein A2Z98_03350 [Spirochaetes bacterium GWB1_27_13]OHD24696.1 MAG: hypothetical protein A2Y34_10795 [Spirochaetes bacterium GWC1_27_15]
MKKTIFLFLFICFFNFVIFSIKIDYSKGPLYGKNMYVPLLIYYSFPSIMASEGKKYQLEFHISNYYVQDFFTRSLNFDPNGEENFSYFNNKEYSKIKRYYDERDILRDYESLNTEFGVSFYILKNLQVGTDFRLITYYGGFLDSVIEAFHVAFGFPGGARELFEKNRISLNIQNKNGVNLKLELDKPRVSIGDIDLWLKYTFFEKKFMSFAGLFAFKIPTGTISNLSGSGFPDIAFGLAADFKPVWILSLYVQTGIVIPFDSFGFTSSKPYPMFNGLLAVELNPFDFFSLIVQFNIKTLPINDGGDMKFGWDRSINYYDLPQINTLVGVKFRYKGFAWQIYAEEDSFTNQGTDLTINAMFSYKIRFFE